VATWPAAIRFPDGTTKYARYSTVVEAVLSGFYSDALLTEPVPPVVADFAPVADLVPVTVTVAPDDRTWHAVVDPARNELVGPRSASIGYDLQERFELARDADGVRHLRARKDVALCGPVSARPGPAFPSSVVPGRFGTGGPGRRPVRFLGRRRRMPGLPADRSAV
jgi:hypothetical protein